MQEQSRVSPRIAVIGAGISGLAAATYLSKRLPTATIEVFEASPRVGGVIFTERFSVAGVGDIQLEHAADNFANLLGHAERFHQTLGIEPELLKPNLKYRFAQVVHDGNVCPIPVGFSMLQPSNLKSILKTPILSTAGKVRVLAEQFVPPNEDDADESLESFAIRRLGREAFERLVEPIVCGIFTAKSDELSMKAALPQFVDMERVHGSLIAAARAARRSQKSSEHRDADSAREATGARYDIFSAPRLGMSHWLEQIVAALPKNIKLHLRKPVTAITRSGSRAWTLQFDENPQEFDGCIVAVSAPSAAKLLTYSVPTVASELAAIKYASSAVLVVGIKASELQEAHRCFGIVVPQIEKKNILAISFSNLKYPGRCSDDQVICRIFLGGAVRPEIFAWSDERLAQVGLDEATKLLQLTTPPLWQKLVRWPNSMPQYAVGHIDRIKRIDEALQTTPTLEVCGNAFRGVGIPQCIFSGETAANSLADSLAGMAFDRTTNGSADR